MTMWITAALCHDKTLMRLNNLGEKISDLTLRGLFWGKNGALAWEKERFKIHKRFEEQFHFITEFLSAFSSTYYAASGNAASRARETSLFFKLFWYWRALRCLRKAEIFSDNFANFMPRENMSLGELDIRASVLNKAGRPDEAIVLLRHGIDKISTEKVGNEHDLCLFLIHEADVIVGMRKYHKDKEAEENYKQAMRLSEDEAVPILTRVRVMKSYGKFLASVGRTNEAKYLLNKAYQSSEANGLHDQTVKIKALLASVK